MSFRDVRALTERLRFLGCPTAVSLESFRAANFALVTELLQWLLFALDPSAREAGSHEADDPDDIDTVARRDISTEDCRVAFIVAVARRVATLTPVRLNTRKLYAADGAAVSELLALADILFGARRALESATSSDAGPQPSLDALHTARSLASSITARAARLHELLATEAEFRGLRDAAAARRIDFDAAERAISDATAAVQAETDATRAVVQSMTGDVALLAAKIDKRQTELDRREKRMRTMQGIRPAYMDEFERHEAELKVLYREYVNKHRNIYYLEQLVDDFSRTEQYRTEEAELSLRKMQLRLKEEELKIMRGDEEHLTDDGCTATPQSTVASDGDNNDDFLADDDEDDGFAPRQGGVFSASSTRMRPKGASLSGNRTTRQKLAAESDSSENDSEGLPTARGRYSFDDAELEEELFKSFGGPRTKKSTSPVQDDYEETVAKRSPKSFTSHSTLDSINEESDYDDDQLDNGNILDDEDASPPRAAPQKTRNALGFDSDDDF